MSVSSPTHDRDTAIAIWTRGLEAVKPRALLRVPADAPDSLDEARRILVVGGGKAGAGMAVALENVLGRHAALVEGLVNVPEGSHPRPDRIRLNPARPAGSNFPTEAGVRGTEEMLALLASAGPEDVAICLLSGGGSALLPAPVSGVTLADKLDVTKRMHAAGASINEMNCVRKHLSRVKGGGMARAFTGKSLTSLIISDVIGDPLDVIASGPTATDPSTFADAIEALERLGIWAASPHSVRAYLREGVDGRVPETAKSLPDSVTNVVIGNNRKARVEAKHESWRHDWPCRMIEPEIDGDVEEFAKRLAEEVRECRRKGYTRHSVVCGGEPTVQLPADHGRGGRNQQLILALMCELGPTEWDGITALSAGTDGEDGPTDAAGAIADVQVWDRARQLGLDPTSYRDRCNGYEFFEQTGGLLRTGLTGTNVMDLVVILIP